MAFGVVGALLSAQRKMVSLAGQAGMGLLSAQYPDDFEHYVFSLDLVDSSSRLVYSFVFPVNPQNVVINHPTLWTVKRSNQGVAAIGTPAFVPFEISLSGTFGRQLKLMESPGAVLNAQGFVRQRVIRDFDTSVKTGYGCVKVLEKLLAYSRQLDDTGNFYRLLFTNMSFNQQFLVVPTGNYTFSVSAESNMVYAYSLTLKAIAPANGLLTEEQTRKRIGNIMNANTITEASNILADAARGIVSDLLP